MSSTAVSSISKDHAALIFLYKKAQSALRYVERSAAAGSNVGIAFGVAARELELSYRAACVLESHAPVNVHLDPETITLHARFALDALFRKLSDPKDESEAREAFWAHFRKATLPSLQR